MDGVRTPRRGDGGFTLVELLVAMAITGMVSVAILALMNSTSDTMNMAESSAETLDRARFALEQVRSQVRNAASYGSVDSRDDPRFVPPASIESESAEYLEWPNTACGAASVDNVPRRLAGLVSYDNADGGYTEDSGAVVSEGWQDYAADVVSDADPDLQSAHSDTNGLYLQFDGLVTVGAYDLPTPFRITDIQETGANCGNARVTVPASPAGTFRLANPDPFDTSGTAPQTYPTQKLQNSTTRVLRIMDKYGNYQFSRICDATLNSDNELVLELTDRPYFQSGKNRHERYGLETCSQSDEIYRAALLDAYWLRVRRDPNDPRNYQLVRDRLNAGGLVADLSGLGQAEISWSGLNPWDHAVQPGNPAVIADRVVDFQIWFDCADGTGTSGAIDGASWEGRWRVIDGEGTPGDAAEEPTNCLNPADPDPARARVAHLRLSMRTANERQDLAHVPFQGGGERMQTFDLYPQSKGAARVTTVQTDFELPNFASRNIVNTSNP